MLMETLSRWIGGVNDVLWTYVLVAALLGCAVWFTLRTRGVQFRLLGEMMRVLGESAGSGPKGERHVSSFQAFAVSLASRVGTGNLAGVATAIVVGGPGAVFWMWVIALVGAASAFVESTLAQLYKRRGRDSFIGGPAYYMERGLGRRWMGVLFAVLIWTCWKSAPMGYLCGGVALVAGFLKYRKIVQYNSLTVKRFRNTYKDHMDVKKFNKFVDTHF